MINVTEVYFLLHIFPTYSTKLPKRYYTIQLQCWENKLKILAILVGYLFLLISLKYENCGWNEEISFIVCYQTRYGQLDWEKVMTNQILKC